jgi:DNA-binding protein YbaB
MSNETDHNHIEPSDSAIALFLQDNDPDQLTDILVAALDEAFRIMEQDIRTETFH